MDTTTEIIKRINNHYNGQIKIFETNINSELFYYKATVKGYFTAMYRHRFIEADFLEKTIHMCVYINDLDLK